MGLFKTTFSNLNGMAYQVRQNLFETMQISNHSRARNTEVIEQNFETLLLSY